MVSDGERSDPQPAPDAGSIPASPLQTELDKLRALVTEAADLLWTANWAAGKLNVSMKRGEVGPRAEFEALVEKRDAMRDWQDRARKVRAPS